MNKNREVPPADHEAGPAGLLRLNIRGIRENNLKSLDVQIEHNKITVITGISGSGKSSLAFDTIYAEGARRYIETFSPYTRQFLDRLHRPDFDTISGVRPALALEQRNRMTSSRSTVGTVTEINDYLKIVWARLSTMYCPSCRTPIQRNSPQQVVKELLSSLRHSCPVAVLITFPLAISGAASKEALSATLRAQGFLRYFSRQSGCIKKIEDLELEAPEDDALPVIVDRLLIELTGDNSPGSAVLRERIHSSIAQSYTYGHGKASVFTSPTGEPGVFDEYRYSEHISCSSCGAVFPEPKPFLFSFNSPLGACKVCHGFGKILTIDPELCVPNPSKSINDDAIACWSTRATAHEMRKLKTFCGVAGIALDQPWRNLSHEHRQWILYGPAQKSRFKGVENWFKKLERKRHKVHVRVFMSRFRGEITCPSCAGSRLQPYAAHFQIEGQTLPEIWKLPLIRLLPFFEALARHNPNDQITEIALEEIISRLRYLIDIGLEYLTLDRQSRTLSGGEFQRVNLTSVLGARLVNTILVLDEPTIGLHARDTQRLIQTLKTLKERGNTVLVVEHDLDVIRSADEIIDLGPLAGNNGGEIVYQGRVNGINDCTPSLTGRYLAANAKSPVIGAAAAAKDLPAASPKFLCIAGARAHNLASLDVSFPLQKLVVITGVSGSGKSTLVRQCLYEPYQKVKQGRSLADIVRQSSSPITGLSGFDAIDDIVLIDQSPAGKTPRSNPATYTKAWDHIRECFAETPQAQRLGLSKSAFSFNVDGGRCPACKGAGQIRIEMQFLADVFIPCAACGGSRFQDKVLEVLFAGKNVLDFLNLTLDETASCFAVLGMDERAQKINLLLQPLLRLGLGYLRLGHPLNNVSGGEAQRIKLASYLSTTAKEKCLFILDEPTTGLHPYNIADLLAVFNELKASGHSLLVIEHNLDVISHADWVVDLGPEGGEKGGRIVAQGPPADLIKNCANFPESSTALLLHNQRGGCRVSAASDAALPFAPPLVRPGEDHAIEIIGAREHNLQNITARIPHNKITVVTGVSGSGKSTLAFDIVFAEGQRRYIDCLSPYARQYIKQLSHADVDRVNYIPPTIAVSQKTAPPLGVSTVATTTEIYQYLRLLYAKAGTQHCVVHDLPITSLTLDSLCATIAHRFKGQRIFLYAPVVTGRKGIYNDLFNRALKAEITEARIDGQVVKLEPGLRLERHKLHSISLAVGSIRNPSPVSSLLREAVEQCLLLGNGSIEVFAGDAWGEPELFSIARVCPDCGRGYRELDPQDFSFRSARGVCVRCSGWGRIAKGRSEVRDTICPDCHGARIGPVGRHVYVENQRIFELTSRSAVHLLHFIQQLKFPPRMNAIVQPIISELQSRLQVIIAVGLDYLELDRDSSSISGGEAQRLRLARALGSPLTGVCYVLDEPSIGLHPQDQEQLMAALAGLRDNGNTVLIVEHDEETIRSADHVIDVGPKGGAEGGGIVICGTPQDIENCQESLTGAALRERSARIKQKILNFPPSGDLRDRDCLIIRGVTTNNLCHISARIPLKRLTVIAGVSGAGKSSLVHGALVPAVIENLTGKKEKKKNCSRNWDSVENLESIERLVEIDQSPPGKTSTSTPASFLGIFDDVRKIYAMLSEARARGWNASHFSFNTGKGRCGECQGKGTIKVPMSFLPDAVNVCESCNGLRYNDSTLEVLYQGISIGDMLQKTMLEARSILANHKAICRSLDYVVELGLGYLTLGQPTYTLSGGEIQRLKIAREFGLREAVNTIYILDEPTIGLHMNDVDKLRNVLQKLVDRENTVVVIEHNLDLIRSADHLIELGPGAAAAGGRVLFAGHPEALLRASLTTPTRTSLLTLKRKIKAKKGANGRNSARGLA